ncbi:hypothetical protein T484DRAFT_1628945 [Baffinella frigidus]|nr:hypothetical protein T484DRAFT_1628945 [Cryptophyta sp. CCMP2293]
MSGDAVEKAAALKRAKADIEKNGLKSNAVQHVIQDRKGEEQTLSDLPDLAAVHFKNCKNCTFTFPADTKVVKVLVEGCTGCCVRLERCLVLTATLEVWRCEDCEVVVDCELGTVQVDLCSVLRLTFAKRENMGSVVQAGVHKMTLSFLDGAHPPVETGLEELRAAHPDDTINEGSDQYISRFIAGALLTERIVRLTNDYPTTLREKQVVYKTNPGAAEQGVDDISDEARANFKKAAGTVAFKAGDFQQAAVHYTEAILLVDKDHTVFSNRAACFLKLGQADKALKDCDACLALSPKFVKAVFRRGVALLGLERFEEAAKAFAATLDLDPK